MHGLGTGADCTYALCTSISFFPINKLILYSFLPEDAFVIILHFGLSIGIAKSADEILLILIFVETASGKNKKQHIQFS